MDHSQVKNDEHQNHGKENVTITINNSRFEIHRGHHTVTELKSLAEIPLAYELNIIINNNFEPLPDDGSVTIKGGEEFISNARDGVSS